MQLAHKSIELERVYIPSIMNMLKEAKSSDLDEMFFGMTILSYKHLRDPISLSEIKEYLDLVSEKYRAPISIDDPYFSMAAERFKALNEELASHSLALHIEHSYEHREAA